MLEGFHDYRSPFDVKPERHEMPDYGYGFSMAYDRESVRRFKEYERKFLADRSWESSHEKWANAREAYATNHQATDLGEMLKHVTLDNPPPAKDLYFRTETSGVSIPAEHRDCCWKSVAFDYLVGLVIGLIVLLFVL